MKNKILLISIFAIIFIFPIIGEAQLCTNPDDYTFCYSWRGVNGCGYGQPGDGIVYKNVRGCYDVPYTPPWDPSICSVTTCWGDDYMQGHQLTSWACYVEGESENRVCQYNGSYCEEPVGGSTQFVYKYNACSPPGGDIFNLDLAPSLRVINKGENTSYSISINNTYVGTMNLAFSCPSGITCSLSQSSKTFNTGSDDDVWNVILNITNTTNATPGTYNIIVSGEILSGGTMSDTSQIQIQDPSACNQLTYKPATSGFSTSSAGPSGPNITLGPGDTFYAFVDYSMAVNSIIPPHHDWQDQCTYQTFNGTVARFICTAPSAGGVYVYSTGNVNYPPPDSNICANSNTIGNVTVITSSPPDLTAGLSSPATATAGTPLTFSSIISNIGAGSTVSGFQYFFQVASESNGGGTITNLTPGSMSALAASAAAVATSPSYTFASSGTKSVRVCADKNAPSDPGVITESNENNNCGAWRDVSVSAAGQPDYLVEGISITGPLTPPGSVLGFSGTVRNQGVAATVSSHTRLRIDIGNNGTWDVVPSNKSTAALPANGTEFESWTNVWTSVAGTHLYQICADVGTAIIESNESNNCASAVFTVFAVSSNFDINLSKSGQGEVVSSPTGINCGQGCQSQSATFSSGDTVILTVTAAPGRLFAGWGGDCSGASPTCSLFMDATKNVYAYFAIDPNYKEF